MEEIEAVLFLCVSETEFIDVAFQSETCVVERGSIHGIRVSSFRAVSL